MTMKTNHTGTFVAYRDGLVDATIDKKDGTGKVFECEASYLNQEPFRLADVKPGDKFRMESEFDASTVIFQRVTKL